MVLFVHIAVTLLTSYQVVRLLRIYVWNVCPLSSVTLGLRLCSTIVVYFKLNWTLYIIGMWSTQLLLVILSLVVLICS